MCLVNFDILLSKKKKIPKNRIVSSRSRRLQFMTIGVNLALKIYVTYFMFAMSKVKVRCLWVRKLHLSAN